jgi:hypothetical protein
MIDKLNSKNNVYFCILYFISDNACKYYILYGTGLPTDIFVDGHRVEYRPFQTKRIFVHATHIRFRDDAPASTYIWVPRGVSCRTC